MNGWLITAVAIYGVVLIFALALCKAAAAADRQSMDYTKEMDSSE